MKILMAGKTKYNSVLTTLPLTVLVLSFYSIVLASETL
jgi:hypothetical protein